MQNWHGFQGRRPQATVTIAQRTHHQRAASLLSILQRHCARSVLLLVQLFFEELLSADVWFEPKIIWEVKAADLSLSPRHLAAIGIVSGFGFWRFQRYPKRRSIPRRAFRCAFRALYDSVRTSQQKPRQRPSKWPKCMVTRSRSKTSAAQAATRMVTLLTMTTTDPIAFFSEQLD